MKVVLLPGMDGTGNLFSPLLKELSDYDCKVIPLPKTGPQDYSSITASVAKQLPTDNFVLIAESFSGPIAAELAKQKIDNLRGIIFVVTFLSTPKKLLVAIAQYLPLKNLSRAPFSKHWIKFLFLDRNTSNDLLNCFLSTIESLPTKLIKDRLRSIRSLSFTQQYSDFPVAYIQAKFDKIVPPQKISEFRNCFQNITIKTINGPHFILQTNPEESALVIAKLITSIEKKQQN